MLNSSRNTSQTVVRLGLVLVVVLGVLGGLEAIRFYELRPPIPFLLLYASVVFSAVFAGRPGGISAGALASGYVIYASLEGFGPPTLTGAAPQVFLGILLYCGTGYFLGSLRDERDALLKKLSLRQQELEGVVDQRTNALSQLVSEMKLRSDVIESSNSGILVYNIDPPLLNFANASAEILVADIDRCKSSPLQLLANDDVMAREVETALLEGSNLVKEFFSRNSAGQEVRLRLHLSSIPTGHVVVLLVDVTTSYEVEQQFLRAQKLDSLGRLTGGVAHDFNNILGIILGNLELARMDANEAADPFIAASMAGVEKGIVLTQRLLDYAGDNSGLPSVFSPSEVAQGIVRIMEGIIPDHVQVETRWTSDWLVQADIGQFENALINLVTNACSAMNDSIDSKLTIAISNATSSKPGEESTDSVLVSIVDSGVGIPAQLQEKILDPFFTTKENGTGLGLSMVSLFVERAEGTLLIKSEPGEGADVSILLPRFIQNDSAISSSDGAANLSLVNVASNKQKVLLVEDDPELRMALKKMMESQEFVVEETVNATAAIELIENGDYHLVLCDIRLKGEKSGHDVYHFIKQSKRNTAVILMSGYPDEFGAGSEVVLRKPFDLETLTKTIRLALPHEALTRKA